MFKCGLILEGGGMRGVYTTGVLDFFIDNNLYFEQIIGVSAGACHACSYKAQQKERAFKVNTNYLNDKRYLSWSNFIKNGSIFGMDMLFNVIPNELYPIDVETYNSNSSKLLVTCTNLNSGEAEYFNVEDIHKHSNYVQASCSLPGLSNIVHINNIPYLDGGIGDSIPLAKSIKDGYINNVLILTRDKDYVKTKNKHLGLMKLKYRKYPKFIEAIKNRHLNYNKTLELIAKEEFNNQCFVIRPSVPLEISSLEKDPIKLKYLYDLGYNDAKNSYNRLNSFLNSL